MTNEPHRKPEATRGARPLRAVSSIAQARLEGLLPVAALGLYLVALLRTAWLSDDAFITLRALDNFVNGYGLLSNPPERVQAFTNPLWALLMLVPYALGAGPYATALGAGLVVSTLTVLLVTFVGASSLQAAALALLWLASSAAFVDFSTGGLENPLSHLLLALLVIALVRGKLDPSRARSHAPFALLVCNRYDHALLVLPLYLWLLFERRPGAPPLGLRPRAPWPALGRAALLGGAPLLAWIAFATVYYGFPLPNTAYAKLNSHVPEGVLATQGFVYVVDALHRDPLTLLVIALGVVALLRERSPASIALAAGVLLYLAYVVWIGGDFMAGRFFTAPFMLCATWLAARGLSLLPEREVVGLALGSLVLCALFPTSFLAHEKLDCVIGPSGIVSERHCWSEFTALSENLRFAKYMLQGRYRHGARLRVGPERVVVATNVGMTGYAAGPQVHIVDPLALTDPLLARIPFRYALFFRIGHFDREVPAGYEQTLRSGKNQIVDPCVHEYYDVLAKVITGPLFTRERFAAILALNTGRYDALLNGPCPRAPTGKPAKRPHGRRGARRTDAAAAIDAGEPLRP